ncbi:MAG TPA: SpoIIE family protein phosphatase [Candidatus Saccharimonadales bacterium]|nr:SpoIIE family protein phosphatase [Candidatus Saccharimonadales bacterium]
MRGMALLAAEAQSAITVLEDRLAAAGQESAELRRELYEAAQMQRYLCGPRLMRRGSFEIAAEMFPVRHLSGDFFCVAELGAMILLGIGDICGKGMLAGMWSIHLLELTRMFGANTGDPGMALRALNKSMCARSPLPPLTSLFLAYMDCESGELLYCNAGHPAALLLRSDGTTQLLSEGGPVLGVLADAEFHSARITMEQGDTLLAFSDGLPECCNESAEEFETERIIAEVRKAESLSTSEMLFSVVGAAQDFAGSCPREDDCTLMVARCVDMPAAA